MIETHIFSDLIREFSAMLTSWMVGFLPNAGVIPSAISDRVRAFSALIAFALVASPSNVVIMVLLFLLAPLLPYQVGAKWGKMGGFMVVFR